MSTYLVGLDRSAPAQAALEWARAMARDDDSITVVHASGLPINTAYDGVTVFDPSVERTAQEFLDRAVVESGDPRLSGRLVMGDGGQGIVELAEETGSDVIIVVGHGGSSKAALLLGSTAHYVIRHTKAPVVVVRGQPRVPVRRVIVGVDMDDDEPDERSLAALRWAVHLPAVERIEAMHADFVPGVAAGPARQPGLESDEERLADDARLRRAIDVATDGSGAAPSGAELVPVVAAGTGAFALIEASRDADLVVVSTRGRSGLVELIAGSTTLEVLSHAHCPVAVIHGDRR